MTSIRTVRVLYICTVPEGRCTGGGVTLTPPHQGPHLVSFLPKNLSVWPTPSSTDGWPLPSANWVNLVHGQTDITDVKLMLFLSLTERGLTAWTASTPVRAPTQSLASAFHTCYVSLGWFDGHLIIETQLLQPSWDTHTRAHKHTHIHTYIKTQQKW